MVVWKLKSGADKRVRGGHPWVFSNELVVSPKGISPGTPIILQDYRGNFVASGYGNPSSLIAFRALSFDPDIEAATEFEYLIEKAMRAWYQRKELGFKRSFRWIYGEGDFFPGLVVDRYLVKKDSGELAQVFAAQILTAGISVAIKEPLQFFRRLCEEFLEREWSNISWENTSVVLRNDVQVRRLEGIEVEDPSILKSVEGVNLKEALVVLDAIDPKNSVEMFADLFEGQKTGFFLDQSHNIELVGRALEKVVLSSKRSIRILDLCCYVGQWSTKISEHLRSYGVAVEATLVDVSESALQKAQKNVERTGAQVICKKLDVMKDLGSLPEKHYDLVIADPPAFIKSKKDIPTGSHAYLKLNASAFKLVKRGGWVASCSCSGLFKEEMLVEALRKASRRNEWEVRCLLKGGHAPDHPVQMSFDEGFYLKMFLHSAQ